MEIKMTLTEQQKQAIELLNQAIAKIVELGECDSGHAVVNAIEKAKEKIIWGDFENGGKNA